MNSALLALNENDTCTFLQLLQYLKLYDLHVFVAIIHSCGRDVHLNVGHFPQLRGLFFFDYFFKQQTNTNINSLICPLLCWRHTAKDVRTEICLLSTRVHACSKLLAQHTDHQHDLCARF